MLAMILGGIGFALIFEGLMYALSPERLKRMALIVAAMDEDSLRAGGLFAIGVGLLVVYVARVLAAAG